MEKESIYHFGIVDYVIFTFMLLISALVGLYYGCRQRYCKNQEEQDLNEYLTGGGDMKPLPVALSLIASFISGVTIMGTPSEIYNFGTQYMFIIFAIWISGVVVAFVYLPIFFKLKVNSSYEYLELRFNSYVRTLVSVLFVLDTIMFMPILIYVPSMAFNQVTDINVHLIGAIVCAICVFYTFLGGLKAVVWTDTLQVIVMIISVVVVLICGTIYEGSIGGIFEKNRIGKRLIWFNFNPSMYERFTLFGILIGNLFYWTSYNAVNQTMVQRYMSLPSLLKSKLSVGIFSLGISIFVFLCCYSGILVYAAYYGCDPFLSKRITTEDQLLALYVAEYIGHLPGIPGLFIAGVFGAALSSLSVLFNSTSLVFLEDFLKGCMGLKLKETLATLIVKVAVIVLGVASCFLMLIIEQMDTIIAVAYSLTSIAAGTSFGIFTLGMVFPWANDKGAMCGGVAGALMSGILSFGSQYVRSSKMVVDPKLPMRVDQCFDKYGISVNVTSPVYPDDSSIFPLFRMAYIWVSPVGVLTVLVVGLIVSFITGKTDLKTLDPDLISPVFQFLLPPEAQANVGSAIRGARATRRGTQEDAQANIPLTESKR